MLPCGHTLNHDTLVNLLGSASEDNDGNQYFQCPIDRRRFEVKPPDEFPRNYSLEQQIAENEKQHTQRKKENKRRLDEKEKEIELRLRKKMKKEMVEISKELASAQDKWKSTKIRYESVKEQLKCAEEDLLQCENKAKEVGLNVVSLITEENEESKDDDEEEALCKKIPEVKRKYKGKDYPPFLQAALDGNVEDVRILLSEKWMDVNQTNGIGSTALIMASGRGHIHIVNLLLQHKNLKINQQTLEYRNYDILHQSYAYTFCVVLNQSYI